MESQGTSEVIPRFRRLLIAAIAMLVSTPTLAGTITGQASVIDGDTIEIHRQRIRLSGIDAPESNQTCRGDDSLQYRCGAKAANESSLFIAGRPVSCKGVKVDRYKRIVAVCSVNGADLGEWLVRAGLAFDRPEYSRGKYAAAQREASRRNAVFGRRVMLYRGTTGLANEMAHGLTGARMRHGWIDCDSLGRRHPMIHRWLLHFATFANRCNFWSCIRRR